MVKNLPTICSSISISQHDRAQWEMNQLKRSIVTIFVALVLLVLIALVIIQYLSSITITKCILSFLFRKSYSMLMAMNSSDSSVENNLELALIFLPFLIPAGMMYIADLSNKRILPQAAINNAEARCCSSVSILHGPKILHNLEVHCSSA